MVSTSCYDDLKHYVTEFMLVVTIPKSKIRKGENETEKRIYDAIYKAHLDTLAGRFHLAKYISLKEDNKKKPDYSLVNRLYELIIEKCRKNKEVELKSDELINILNSEFDVEFGAVQKLVNMTLKYLLILKTYSPQPIKDNFSSFGISCHCPLDSIILSKLKEKNRIIHSSWTKLQKEEYFRIQEEIQTELLKVGVNLDNVWFDFMNWEV